MHFWLMISRCCFEMSLSADEIDALLPQTQCGECGFAGCRPYAEAMAKGQAPDGCPPGGVETLHALANLLKIDAKPFEATVKAKTRPPAVANIREEDCIGCTKCIDACPVDAIIGSGKLMHAVIVPECTGCGLCVDPCPVDCIDLLPLEAPRFDKLKAKQRFQARAKRQEAEEQAKQQAYQEKQAIPSKQDYILQALARVKAKTNE